MAPIIASMWRSNWSPTDMVTSKMKDGIGTKGIKDAKKLTKAKPR